MVNTEFEFEELAANLPQVEQTVTNLSSFSGMVNLVSFAPFKDGIRALENANAISEGILHDDLQLFLEANLPKPGKKNKVVLGIADPKIGATLSENMHISCQTGGAVPEIMRGIRLHFAKLIKGLTSDLSAKAQLGLGHSYSRAKVKFNVHRVDNMIIQSIAILDQLDKDINTFAMRIREWYGYHFPELVRIIPDNYMYTQLVSLIGERKTLDDEKIAELKTIVQDEEKVKHIIEAARTSIGADIPEIDLHNVQTFCQRVSNLAEYRLMLHQYLRSKMQQCAPNLAALIGEQVGARLISHAGSLTNLAKFPASTVQILGAEKALFRALKTRGNTPKYGLIYHSSFIGKAKSKDKGRVSRYLANKCSIATRLDCFSEVPTSVVGEHLRKQVEDRLKYIEGGENPRKNIDVMQEAVQEAETARQTYLATVNKSEKKKKKKKVKLEVAVGEEEGVAVKMEAEEAGAESEEPQKKKKKKRDRVSQIETPEEPVTAPVEEEDAVDASAGKKKKKKA